VTRRSKRALKEDLEVVTYNVSFENGSQLVEDLTQGQRTPKANIDRKERLQITRKAKILH
jgi:hypothetical protein